MEIRSEYCISNHNGKNTIEVFDSLEDAKIFYEQMEEKDAYMIFEIIWQGVDGDWSIVNVFPVEEEIF